MGCFLFYLVFLYVSVRVYCIGGYCRLGVLLLFTFGFIISDDIFVTDDGNGIGVLLGACVPSVRLPW